MPSHAPQKPLPVGIDSFEKIIQAWFKESMPIHYLQDTTNALLEGDIGTFSDLFSTYIEQALSYFDIDGQSPENFYHALVLGMIVHLRNRYEIKSNRESGLGRYDVMLIPLQENKPGIIIEFKKVNTSQRETLALAADRALEQIVEKRYATELKSRGIQNILSIAIAIDGKNVLVRELTLRKLKCLRRMPAALSACEAGILPPLFFPGIEASRLLSALSDSIYFLRSTSLAAGIGAGLIIIEFTHNWLQS